MANRGLTAHAYHRATRHFRNRIRPHSLDFASYPNPAKSYAFLKSYDFAAPAPKGVPGLDRDPEFGPVPYSGGPAREKSKFKKTIALPDLFRVLTLAYGVRKKFLAGRIPLYLRTSPSAGGLYPCQIYLVAWNIPALDTGLYYCSMIQEFLGLIQKGRAAHPDPENSGFAFVISAKIFNSAWKYRERAYRYLLLDTGHVAENLSLALTDLGLRTMVGYDFDDRALCRYLSLNRTRSSQIQPKSVQTDQTQPGQTQPGYGGPDRIQEIPLAWVAPWQAGREKTDITASFPELTGPVAAETSFRQRETDYPLILQAWESGSATAEAGIGTSGCSLPEADPVKEEIPLETVTDYGSKICFETVVLKRKSRRNFVRDFLDREKCETLLQIPGSLLKSSSSFDRFGHGFHGSGQVPKQESRGLVVGVSVEQAESLADGFYLFSNDGGSLSLIKEGRFQTPLAQACLDQNWVAHAAMNFLFIIDFAALEAESDQRQYRRVLMTAGRMAQRIYLAVEHCGLGCCGVGAIYDDEAAELFALTETSALFYVVSAGPVK